MTKTIEELAALVDEPLHALPTMWLEWLNVWQDVRLHSERRLCLLATGMELEIDATSEGDRLSLYLSIADGYAEHIEIAEGLSGLDYRLAFTRQQMVREAIEALEKHVFSNEVDDGILRWRRRLGMTDESLAKLLWFFRPAEDLESGLFNYPPGIVSEEKHIAMCEFATEVALSTVKALPDPGALSIYKQGRPEIEARVVQVLVATGQLRRLLDPEFTLTLGLREALVNLIGQKLELSPLTQFSSHLFETLPPPYRDAVLVLMARTPPFRRS